jgi:hypothetical protein
MLDPATTAIITGAAGNVVAYMLNGRADALRTWMARIFRTGTEEQRFRPFHMLEEDIAALTNQLTSEADVQARWSDLLASHLAAHPEARADIGAMGSTPIAMKTVGIGTQHNHGSGTFIGGDNYGHINSPTTGES